MIDGRLVAMALMSMLAMASVAEAGDASRRLHVARILTNGDGQSPDSAFRITSAADERDVLAAMKVEPRSRSLVLHETKALAKVSAIDEHGGDVVIWFDVDAMAFEPR